MVSTAIYVVKVYECHPLGSTLLNIFIMIHESTGYWRLIWVGQVSMQRTKGHPYIYKCSKGKKIVTLWNFPVHLLHLHSTHTKTKTKPKKKKKKMYWHIIIVGSMCNIMSQLVDIYSVLFRIIDFIEVCYLLLCNHEYFHCLNQRETRDYTRRIEKLRISNMAINN